MSIKNTEAGLFFHCQTKKYVAIFGSRLTITCTAISILIFYLSVTTYLTLAPVLNPFLQRSVTRLDFSLFIRTCAACSEEACTRWCNSSGLLSLCCSPCSRFIGQHFEVGLKSSCQLPSLLTDVTIMHFTKSHYLFILAEWLKQRQHLAGASASFCSSLWEEKKKQKKESRYTAHSHLTV